MAGDTTITLIGNLTADPTLRFLPTGKAVANVTIASTPRSFNKQSNSWEDGDPMFLRGSAWGPLAENVTESLSKGDRVIATGKLKQRSYEKDGIKHTVCEVDLEEIGPSLTFATARPTRASKSGGGRTSPGNAWSDDEDAPPF